MTCPHITSSISNVWPGWPVFSLVISSQSLLLVHPLSSDLLELQSSVIGPILFSIYTHSLDDYIQTWLQRPQRGSMLPAQTCLLNSTVLGPTDYISTWLSKRYLKFNKFKTKLPIFLSKPVSPAIIHLRWWQHHLSSCSSKKPWSRLWLPSHSHTPHPTH